MKYRVHRIEVYSGSMQERLEGFINNIKGEVVAVLPNVKPPMMIFWGTARIDYVLVVEKLR